jgi:hypothetical protein
MAQRRNRTMSQITTVTFFCRHLVGNYFAERREQVHSKSFQSLAQISWDVPTGSIENISMFREGYKQVISFRSEFFYFVSRFSSLIMKYVLQILSCPLMYMRVLNNV